MKVAVAGANGLIGSNLVRALRARGDEVVPLVRNPRHPGEVRWDPRAGGEWTRALEGVDGIVNLAGANIGGKRWSEEYKKEMRDSRLQPTRALVEAMRAASRRPRVFVSASAVGYYGDRGDDEVTEATPAGSDFLAGLCKDWEEEAGRAEQLGVRTVLLRTGVVLDREDSALAKMLPPFKAFLGGPIGSGRQWFPWIHIADEVGLILWALEGSARGPVDAVSPAPVRMKEFARALGRALHRPAVLPVPAFALRLAVGEMAEVLLGGQRALPKKALDGGYRFRFDDVDRALQDVLSRSASA
ncbi:MAG: TIGR01777 family protein [Deltaproteobacteria bacterium]|nr:MAG: TIGR01777 family protein [Deltaproteobacteria bacterium]